MQRLATDRDDVPATPSGDNLAAVIARASERRLPLDQTLRIGERLCAALEGIHALGGAHGALNPTTARLRPDGDVRLDAAVLAHDVPAQLTPDTAGYLAPEQLLGGQPTARADLYALGALLYELTTGRPPFPGDDVVAITSRQLHSAPVAPAWHNPYLPRPLDALILRLLAKEPADRPASAAAVRAELAAITVLAGSPFLHEQRVARDAANPLDRLAAGVFVGRARELGQLRAACDAALAGRAGVVLLAGEPGIGKTTLAAETATYAGLHGARVLWGRCYEWEGAPAYWPWVQIIRAAIPDRDPEGLRAELGPGAAEIAQLVPEVRELLPDIPAPPRAEGEQARFRLFDAIARFLRALAADQPLLLVLDDLHWADTPSLLLLQFVARELERARLLLVGTFRDVEVGRRHPLEPALAELARGHGTARVLLPGLNTADVARFIALTTGREPDPALVEAVQRETEGNPFFVSEVVRLLVAEGRLDRPPELPWNVGIPASVRDVVVRRLDRLSESCNDALSVAAVLGREFTLALLEAVSGLEADAALDALEEALRARLIQAESSGQRYRFTHALVQDTLYAELGAGRRLRLHARVGEALERAHAGELAPYYAELAHHFALAAPVGGAERAITYASMAGDRAMAQVAWETAIQHYERALAVIEQQPEPDAAQRCDVLLALGSAQYHLVLDISDAPGGQAAFIEAARIAAALGSFERLARAALGFAGINVVRTAGGLQQVELLEDALALAPSGDSALKARVLARLAVDVRLLPGTAARAIALSDEALAMARRLGDPAVLAFVLIARFSVIWSPDSVVERLALATESLRPAVAAGDIHNVIWSHHFSSCTRYEVGDGPEWKRAITACIATAEESKIPYFHWAMERVNESGAAIIEGRFSDAMRHISAIGGDSTALVAVYFRTLLLFLLRRAQGEPLAVDDQFQPVIELTGRSADPFDRHRGHIAQAVRMLWLHEIGRVDDARVAFDTFASQDFADLTKDAYWLATLVLLVEVAVLLNDRRRAGLLYDLLLPYANRNALAASGAVYLGPVDHRLGLVATLFSHWDDAERHFEQALAINARMHARPDLARTQHAYAAMLLQRAASGDRERARELLEQARAAAEALGMRGLAEQTAAQLAMITSTAQPSAGELPYGLSARELEVLLLIAAGQPDREIAAALYISPRTVSTHVSHIFNKLDLNNRAEAAAFAVRHGLV